jgi:hypothetical protein
MEFTEDKPGSSKNYLDSLSEIVKNTRNIDNSIDNAKNSGGFLGEKVVSSLDDALHSSENIREIVGSLEETVKKDSSSVEGDGDETFILGEDPFEKKESKVKKWGKRLGLGVLLLGLGFQGGKFYERHGSDGDKTVVEYQSSTDSNKFKFSVTLLEKGYGVENFEGKKNTFICDSTPEYVFGPMCGLHFNEKGELVQEKSTFSNLNRTFNPFSDDNLSYTHKALGQKQKVKIGKLEGELDRRSDVSKTFDQILQDNLGLSSEDLGISLRVNYGSGETETIASLTVYQNGMEVCTYNVQNPQSIAGCEYRSNSQVKNALNDIINKVNLPDVTQKLESVYQGGLEIQKRRNGGTKQ